VIALAERTGWSHTSSSFDAGAVIRDTFGSQAGDIRVYWIRTTWAPDGRYAGAIYHDRRDGIERNAWSLDGKRPNSLTSFLREGPLPTQ
jgi:hypothetical protein